ncbi:calcium/manganese antiporter SLC30A10 isoform X1 [Lissotriton helveticus]
MGRYTGRTCRLIFMLVITAGFFVVELVVGYLGNSIALVSDSFNMLSDLISLCVGITASCVSRRARRGPAATFGYARAEVVGALSNAVFLTALCFTILVEAVLRLARPEIIDAPGLVLVVGALGLGVNIVGLLVFQDYGRCRRLLCGARGGLQGAPETEEEPRGAARRESDGAGDTLNIEDGSDDEESKKEVSKAAALNIRGVLLHVMGDALGSVIVVITATIFYIKPLSSTDQCNWQCYIDPSLTLVMVIIILSSAFPLIKETATILLQMVPKGVDVQEIGEKIKIMPGVGSIHEVHVWELAGGRNIASLHIKCKDTSDYQTSTKQMRKVFHDAGIHSVTIQPEFTDQKDFSTKCNSACISSNCDSQLCCSQKELENVECNGHVDDSSHSTDLQYKMNGIKKEDIEISVGYLCEGGVSEKGNEDSKEYEQTEVETLYAHKF